MAWSPPGFSILGNNGGGAPTAVAGYFSQCLGGNAYWSQSDETIARSLMPVNGTLSGLATPGPAGAFTLQLRKNLANANQSVTQAALISGASDACVIGDQIDLAWTAAAAATVPRTQMTFQGAAQHGAIWGSTPYNNAKGTIPANNSAFLTFVGYDNALPGSSTYIARSTVQIGVAGLLQGLSHNTGPTNTTTSATSLLIYQNGASVANSGPTIGAGLTGLFQDTTHQTPVAVGDLVCAYTFATGGGLGFAATTVGFVNPNAPSNDIFFGITTSLGAGATSYFPLVGGGQYGGTPTEAPVQTVHGFAVTMSGLRLSVETSATTGVSTIASRKNGAAGNQSASIGAGLTGWFKDTTNQDIYVAADKANYQTVIAAGGMSSVVYIGSTETAPNPATSPSYSLIAVATTGSISGQAGNFSGFASEAASIGSNATESNLAYPWPAAGTIQGLTSAAPGPGASGTWGLQFRKNGANGNQSISNSATSDLHGDLVAPGDLIDLQWTASTAGYTLAAQAIFAPSGPGHFTNYAAQHSGGGVTLNGGATIFPRLWGNPGAQTVESGAQVPVNTPGTVSGMSVIFPTNTAIATTTIYFRKNGANSAIGFTVAAGLTGLFRDTTQTDTIAAGDLICGEMLIPSAGGAVTCTCIGVAFQSNDGRSQDYFTGGGGAQTAAQYLRFIGAVPVTPGGAEPPTQATFGFAVTLSRATAAVSPNPSTTASTLVSRVNGANGAQTVSVGAGLTGTFQDTTHVDVLAATDLANLLLTPGTGGLTMGNSPITVSTSMSWGVSLSELGAALDTVTSVGLHPATVTEAGAAADTTDSTALHPASVAEAGAASDTTDSAALHPVSVSEAGAAVETTSSQLTHSGDLVAELGAASDTVHINGVYPSAVIEGGVANDIVIAFNGIGQYTLEEGSALDTPRVISLVTRPVVYEAARALDTPSAGVRRENDIIEQLAAQDFTEGFDLIKLAVIEQGQARDAQIVMGSLAYAQVLGMTARVVHRHPVTGGILDDETIPLLDDQGVPMFEDS
jgi:hypothetical protein